jgi:GNAT superfamily N-acetyltransferase
VAAFDGRRMLGYLFADAQFDQLMGRTAWVRIAGHALAQDEDAGLYQHLYAASAPTWLELGCFNHYVQVMASDTQGLQAWFATSFGQQQAHGLRQILPSDANPQNTLPGIEIRRARPEDRQAFSEMAFCTAEYQVQPAVWAPLPPEISAERPIMYASVLDDEDATLWLAMKDDRVAGFQVYYPAENNPEDLYIPEHAAEMPAASTRLEFRGQGVTRALAQYGFDFLRQEGFNCCLTDWRTTNLLSSRAWPGLGYQPVMYRLHRRVDERILWAKGLGGTRLS